jgi:ABC-type transporter Mla subunit MlaD
MLPRLTTILIIVVGVVTLSLFFSRPKLYRQEFKAYFKTGQALRNGAEVRVAGIPSGVVKSVQIRPEHREAPVEVVFEVQTTYDLQIPRDSAVRLSSEGALGNTCLDIDVTQTTGPPASTHAVLRTEEEPPFDARRVVESLVELNERILKKSESVKRIPEPKATPRSAAPTR